MFRSTILLTVTLISCLVINRSVSSFEEAKQSDSPEQIVKKAIDAMKEDRMDDFAELMHPDALQSFKDSMVSIVEGATKLGQEKQILRLFDGVASADDLTKLDGAQVFVSFMRGYGRLRPEMRKSLAETEAHIVGHVAEGKEFAHVVCRMTMTVEGVKVTKLEVISVKRTDSGWAMLLRGDIETMAAALLQRFGGEKLKTK